VLKDVGVLTRGRLREEFEKRTMRMVSLLEKRGRIEKYKAKNNRLRLVAQKTANMSFQFWIKQIITIQLIRT